MTANTLRKSDADAEFRRRYHAFKARIEDQLDDPDASRPSDMGWFAQWNQHAWSPADHIRILHMREGYHSSPIAMVDVSHGIQNKSQCEAVSTLIEETYNDRYEKWSWGLKNDLYSPKPRKPYLPTWKRILTLLTDAEKAAMPAEKVIHEAGFLQHLRDIGVTYNEYLEAVADRDAAAEAEAEASEKAGKPKKSRIRKGKAKTFLFPQVHYLRSNQPLDIAGKLQGFPDTYMSLNVHKLWRKEANWATLGCLFADLDNPETAHGISAQELTHNLLALVHALNLPAPSYVMFTGVGIAPIWLHNYAYNPADPTRSGAMPKWKLAQLCLLELLKHFDMKPDERAKDSTRLMRIAGTVNTKSGETVRPFYVHDRDADGNPTDYLTPTEYDFCDLAQRIIDARVEHLGPIWVKPKAEYEADKATRTERREQAKQQAKGEKLFSFAAAQAKQRRPIKGLYGAVLGDIFKLIEGRENLSGCRDYLLFNATIALCQMSEPDVALAEVKRIARMLDMNEDDAIRQMGTALKRARNAKLSIEEKAKLPASSLEAPYRISTKVAVAVLKVTPEEMRRLDLRALIDDDLRAERKAEQTVQKREKAAQKRAEERATKQSDNPDVVSLRRYKAAPESISEVRQKAQQSADKAKEMQAQGMSLRGIAEALGYSKSGIAKLLKAG